MEKPVGKDEPPDGHLPAWTHMIDGRVQQLREKCLPEEGFDAVATAEKDFTRLGERSEEAALENKVVTLAWALTSPREDLEPLPPPDSFRLELAVALAAEQSRGGAAMRWCLEDGRLAEPVQVGLFTGAL
ncbi:hypothetical protein AALO_G00191520 [Alosa alosa]|uniref:Uncharacterized protein n=1 Tax=Alosa alosa TaxID=278164 RepID=A0AAV6G5D8_9TELE|nr:hypothetical protein AALO_G00191520 [Alosa alosa]